MVSCVPTKLKRLYPLPTSFSISNLCDISLSIYSKISPVIVQIPSFSPSSVLWTVVSSQMCDILVFFSTFVRTSALSLIIRKRLRLPIYYAGARVYCVRFCHLDYVTKFHRPRNVHVSLMPLHVRYIAQICWLCYDTKARLPVSLVSFLSKCCTFDNPYLTLHRQYLWPDRSNLRTLSLQQPQQADATKELFSQREVPVTLLQRTRYLYRFFLESISLFHVLILRVHSLLRWGPRYRCLGHTSSGMPCWERLYAYPAST
jgi:hypothetical protein